MTQMNRWKQIVNLLQNQGTMSAQEIAKTLDISIATVRRDLAKLEEENAIIRTWGGAMIRVEETEEPDMKSKSFRNSEAKEQIAECAASLIQDGMTVCMDSGSTTLSMIKFMNAKDIMVVTNGVLQAKELAEKGIRTFLLPGEIKQKTLAAIGPKTIDSLSSFNFDLCFVGSNGVDEGHGFSTHQIDEGEVKRMMIRKSRIPYILADSSKFRHSYFITFAQLSEAILISEKKRNDFDYSKTRTIFVHE